MQHSTDSPQWQRAAATGSDIHNDAIIAVGLFCLSTLTLALGNAMDIYEDPAGPVVSLLCLMLATLPLAFRRVRPVTVAVGVSIRWAIVAVMGLWLLTAFFRATLDPEIADETGVGGLTPALASKLLQLVINILYFAAAIWFGNHAWERARAESRLEEQADELRSERQTVAAQAVALERLRIARELHDSVAHHVSLMGVQAGAARTVLHTDNDQAEQFIWHIEDSARRSVAEMRSLLGVLRDEDPGESPEQGASSALGVDQMQSLITEARAAGLKVDYSVLGEAQPLRPLVSLGLYRIAQEALTNVRKHAGRAATRT